jgi:hypothetical protein
MMVILIKVNNFLSGITQDEKVTDEYIKRTLKVAEKQIARAGKRMAYII